MHVSEELNYNCSNALFSLVTVADNFILALIKHPVQLLFPKTLHDLMMVSNLKVFNECEVMAVWPHMKCNFIHKLVEIVKKCANGDTKPAICKKKLFGKFVGLNRLILKICLLVGRSGYPSRSFLALS